MGEKIDITAVSHLHYAQQSSNPIPENTQAHALSHLSTHARTQDKIRSKYREMERAWLHFAAGQIMHFVTETHTYTHTRIHAHNRARSLNLAQHWNQHRAKHLNHLPLLIYNTQPPLFCTHTHTRTQSIHVRGKISLAIQDWVTIWNQITLCDHI